MIVHARLAVIKGIKLQEWILRFIFGGAVCVIAGLIAHFFGPLIGGFFLAFPAIFPASASLVEAHEKQHKARAGFDGTNRGRKYRYRVSDVVIERRSEPTTNRKISRGDLE